MKDLLEGLSMIFLKLQIVDSTNSEIHVLVFSVSCGIIGAIAVALDFIIFYMQGRSVLQLKHGWNTCLFLLFWSIGAFIIGWIGQMAKVFIVSMSSSVLVGFTWPVILTKILEVKAQKEAENEPEQGFIEEE